jgi:hypothetical protein
MAVTMSPEESPDERTCPVCDTPLPRDPSVRRCPSCGARAIAWIRQRQLDSPVVLFNARLAGIMAGIFVGMLALLVLGYRFPLPWAIALAAMSLPVAGYIAFGELARKVPASWRTQYMVGVLSLNAGLLAALIAGVIGLTHPIPLTGITAVVAVLTWPIIRRAVTSSMRTE